MNLLKKLKGIIIGCGINLNLDKDEVKNIDIPATSIFLETGKRVDKKEFINKLLDNFINNYNEFSEFGIKGEILC